MLYHLLFIFDSDEEIVDGLAKLHIVETSHTTKMVNDERTKSRALVATSGIPLLPDNFKYGYEPVSVRPYVSKPLRCFKCQHF